MFIIDWVKKLLKKEETGTAAETSSIYMSEDEVEEIHSVWDYLRFAENTQAFHISSILSFEEWISMEEILRRIRELFRMDYKNDRSLYPYIKTLVDIGVVETNNVGGKKKWRKKDILIKLQGTKTEKEAETAKVKSRE